MQSPLEEGMWCAHGWAGAGRAGIMERDDQEGLRGGVAGAIAKVLLLAWEQQADVDAFSEGEEGEEEVIRCLLQGLGQEGRWA